MDLNLLSTAQHHHRSKHPHRSKLHHRSKHPHWSKLTQMSSQGFGGFLSKCGEVACLQTPWHKPCEERRRAADCCRWQGAAQQLSRVLSASVWGRCWDWASGSLCQGGSARACESCALLAWGCRWACRRPRSSSWRWCSPRSPPPRPVQSWQSPAPWRCGVLG